MPSMEAPQLFRSKKFLLGSFFAVMLVLSVAFVWLGWRLIEQDRSLEKQRSQERLEYAADRVAVALQQNTSEFERLVNSSLSATDSELRAFKNAGTEDVLVVIGDPDLVQTHPVPIPYYPGES